MAFLSILPYFPVNEPACVLTEFQVDSTCMYVTDRDYQHSLFAWECLKSIFTYHERVKYPDDMTAKTDIISERPNDHNENKMTTLDINRSSSPHVINSAARSQCQQIPPAPIAKNSPDHSELQVHVCKETKTKTVSPTLASERSDKTSEHESATNRNNNNWYSSGDPNSDTQTSRTSDQTHQLPSTPPASGMAPTSSSDVGTPDSSTSSLSADARDEATSPVDDTMTSSRIVVTPVTFRSRSGSASSSGTTLRRKRVEARVRANNASNSNGHSTNITSSFSVRQATKRFANSSTSRSGTYPNAAVAVVPPIAASSNSHPPRPPTPSRRGSYPPKNINGSDSDRMANCSDGDATTGVSANYFYYVDRNGDTILLNADIYSNLMANDSTSGRGAGVGAPIHQSNGSTCQQRLSFNLGATNVFPAILQASTNTQAQTHSYAGSTTENENATISSSVRRGSVVITNCAAPACIANNNNNNNSGSSVSSQVSATNNGVTQQQHVYQHPSHPPQNNSMIYSHLPLVSHNSIPFRVQQQHLHVQGYTNNTQVAHNGTMSTPVRMMLCGSSHSQPEGITVPPLLPPSNTSNLASFGRSGETLAASAHQSSTHGNAFNCGGL